MKSEQRKISPAAIVAMLAVMAAPAAWGQSAGIEGHLVAPDSESIDSGRVFLICPRSPIGLPIPASADGGFGVMGVFPGEYLLMATAKGYRNSYAGICLGSGERANLCIALRPETQAVRIVHTDEFVYYCRPLPDSPLGEAKLSRSDLRHGALGRIFGMGIEPGPPSVGGR
jgi:hypothetical protein